MPVQFLSRNALASGIFLYQMVRTYINLLVTCIPGRLWRVRDDAMTTAPDGSSERYVMK